MDNFAAKLAMVELDLIVVPDAASTAVAVTAEIVEAVAVTRHAALTGRPDVRVVSPAGGLVPLRGGLMIDTVPMAAADEARPWVVVPGIGASSPQRIVERLARPDIPQVAGWLRRAARRGSGIAASCTGTFLAAHAGVLDGHRVTTTWWLGGEFARLFPRCRLDAARMVVDDGPVVTAGAALGHVDLLLHLVAGEYGADAARAVEGRMAASTRFSQAAFARADLYGTLDPDIAAIERHVYEHIDEAITLAELAGVVGMSTRTLSRHVARITGMPPLRLVQRIRVDTAIDLLRGGPRRSLAQVARGVGLADAAALHRLFVRVTGQPPGTFRTTRDHS